MPDTCACCGKPVRLGVALSPLKARLFDVIERAGPDGITGDDLFAIVFSERHARRKTMVVHVVQINRLIARTGYRIDGRGGAFRLRRTIGSGKHGAIFLGVARA